MELTLHTDHIQLTEDLEDFIEKKLSKLERYLPNIESIYVELAQQHSTRGPDMVNAQVTVTHHRGAILRTEEKVEKKDYHSIKAAINGASDKMYRRIRRFKGKSRSKRLRERYAMTEEEFTLAEPLPIETDSVLASDEEPQAPILRRKRIPVSAMYEEEAVEQMELLGHSFFVFFNAETNIVNVVYQRRSGGYGILIPEII